MNEKAWWWAVTALSVFLASIIGLMWYQVSHRNLVRSADYAPVTGQTNLNTYLKKEYGQSAPSIKIPTGIFVEQAHFARKDNEVYPGVLLTGYVWQHYTNGIHDDIARDIIFPDLGGTIFLRQINNIKARNQETILWMFTGHFFQNFNIQDYPFDHRHIKLQLTHPSFAQGVMLVPDFDSYSSTDPQKMPGLSKSLSIPHWEIDHSLFTYSKSVFDTSFGVPQFANKLFPQLHFYIVAQRKLLDTFTIYLFLLLLTAIILFIALMAFLKHERLVDMVGFSTVGILGVCSSLVFVLITSQIDMRETLAIEGTTYIDYLYFILYFFIVLVTINSVTFVLHEHVKFIQYKDNIVAKMLFWPLLLGLVMVVTYINFY